jgi:hypothetical protein
MRARVWSVEAGTLLTCLTLTVLAGCTDEGLTALEDPTAAAVVAESVGDLTVVAASESSVQLRWTAVSDGTDHPALYEVKYSAPEILWATAVVGCDSGGSTIGAPVSCTIEGLEAATTYDFQLVAYRLADDRPVGSAFSNVAKGTTAAPGLPNASPVADLSVAASTDSTMTVHWTEVSDGQGNPAWYRLRYAVPPLDWEDAEVGCDSTLVGTSIGARQTCTIGGLLPNTEYAVQVMSYRNLAEGAEGEQLSNVSGGRTDTATAAALSTDDGIWISRTKISRLPTSGSAWTNLLSAASQSCGRVDLSDQNQKTNVCVLAKALVFARTGTPSYRTDVVRAIEQIVSSGTYHGRALALGRELGAYVVAADLIRLKGYDADLDRAFRSKLRNLRTTYTSEGPSNLIECHEKRPNNWGTHCGATRVAIAAYLGDSDDLARAARVFRGFLGDRSSYASFNFGGPEDDMTWHCDPRRPVAINPAGCERNGRMIDGILPDDQRRSGSYSWPADHENYVWEALQGVVGQAVILSRAGYDVWNWENRAILRAVRWLYNTNRYPAEGDDTWMPHIVNQAYGTSFSAPVPAKPGKNFGWSDWTHR